MDRWTCPDCRREFGRRGQSHMCSPGLTVDEYFDTAQPWERPIFDIVAAHLESLGDVIIDPIAMGVMFLGWLTEAYHFAGGTLDTLPLPSEPSAGSDPMVPDDVDDPFG